LRLAILDHVRMFVAEPATVLETLSALALNRREPVSVRQRAIDTLRALGDKGRPAAAALVALVSDPAEDTALRLSAAQALRQTGWAESDSAVLAKLLFDPEIPNALRTVLAELAGRMEPFPTLLATQWLPVLGNPSAPLAARRLAARMLAAADLGLPDGLALSARLLRDRTEDLQIRIGAGEFLRRSGVRAAPARETLEGILLSEEAPAELREVASTALAQVAQVWLDRPDQLDRAALNRHLAAIEHTEAVMAQADLQMPPHPQNLEAVRRLHGVLRAEKASRWSARLGDWAEAHPGLARWLGGFLALGLCGGLLTAVWWTMSRIAPLQLGALDSRLRRFELTFPRASGGRSIGLRHLLLLSVWSRHERVLEAWTRWLRARTGSGFGQRTGETADGPFLELPVKVDGAVHESCPFEFLFHSLTVPGGCVGIVGDAGTGKSTLARQLVHRACTQVAHDPRPAFLPVWIDTPIRHARSDLIAAGRAQLDSNSRDHETPSAVLLETLLARGRVVPVVDGVSEWNVLELEGLWQALEQLGNPSVLITARDGASLAHRRFVQVETPRLAGPELARFVAGWLAQGEPAAAETDVLEACGYWAELTAGRAMPADIVRVFAEYLLLEREAPIGKGRPENVLELVRDYVRQRNRRVGDGPLPEESVLQAAGQLAWVCVRPDGPVDSSQLPDSIPPELVAYLEQKLALIRIHPGTGALHFLQPTLADYLAAGHLIDEHGRDDAAWHRLESLASVTGNTEGASGGAGPGRLAEALWNACYRWSDPFAPIPIPEWFLNAIERQMDASGDVRLRPSPKLRQLVRLVLAPENSERTAAIEALAALGAGARPALGTMLSVFQKPGEDLEIRHAVLTVILLLGSHATGAVPGLRLAIQNRKEHLFLRIKAIDALMAAAPNDPATIQLLIDKSRDAAESGLLRDRASQAVAKPAPVESGSTSVPDPGIGIRARL